MQKKAALVIVFNHRYDKNIPVLEDIYEDRFSTIYFLVPFYDGDKENVIPVYESSFQFQGYLAQGFRHYFNEEHEHYLFVADDLLLHPSINENNYKEYFGLTTVSSFIPEIYSLHNLADNNTLRFLPIQKKQKTKWYWWRLKQIMHYHHGSEGVETKNEMPPYEKAKTIIESQGYAVSDLTFEDVFADYKNFKNDKEPIDAFKFLFKKWKHRKGIKLSYPVVGSYSDIVIVSAASIKKFVHYCGVFAANGMFVEFAIPTALLLSSKKVVTQSQIKKEGAIYWPYTQQEIAAYEMALAPFNGSLSSLLQNFPSNKLYIHPIKLSKWNYATVKRQA